MKMVFHGSSLLSSYWNGAATYYRGMLRALASRGYRIHFLEPDAFGRQEKRDMEPPGWCDVTVWPASPDGLRRAALESADADIVVKASGVGYEDDQLHEAVLAAARPDALKIFWDVDAPATLAMLSAQPDAPLHGALRRTDLVLTYGGGEPVVARYRNFGVRRCIPVHNGLDPSTHHPVAPQDRFVADLSFLGNRLPDREARVEDFLLDAASLAPDHSFLIGGAGWEDKEMPRNIRRVGHVGTADHNAFNVTPKAVLNICRADMAAMGHSPATRIFEAAGAGACIITDAWEGIERFLRPDSEILIARDGREVAEIVGALDRSTARQIGRRARERVLGEHTYDRRAEEVDAVLDEALAINREAVR